MVVYMPMLEQLKVPGNVMIVIAGLISVATFDLVDTSDLIDQHLFTMPESQPYSPGFEQCGMDSTSLLENSSVMLWTIIGFLLLALTLAILLLADRICCRWQPRNCCTRYLKSAWLRLISSLKSNLFLGGFIRLLMEVYFDIALAAAVNLLRLDKDTEFPAVAASNVLAYILLGLLAIAPFVLLIGLLCNRTRLNDPEF